MTWPVPPEISTLQGLKNKKSTRIIPCSAVPSIFKIDTRVSRFWVTWATRRGGEPQKDAKYILRGKPEGKVNAWLMRGFSQILRILG